MNKIINTIFVFYLMLIPSCIKKKQSSLDWTSLMAVYSGAHTDSFKLSCAKFLKENISDITSEKVTFLSNNDGQEFNIDLDTVLNQQQLKSIVAKNNLSVISKRIPDSLVISNAFLKQNIDDAVNTLNKYSWNKGIPKEIFLNYLLPYKVLDEYPGSWRGYFSKKYQSLRDSFISGYRSGTDKQTSYTDPNAIYYKTIVENAGKWFHYNSRGMVLATRPGLSEIMCIKEGDCIPESYLSVYILRSLGIAAAVDFIPFWGSRNSGHFSAVFYKNGKMVAASGREIKNPAKVFRMSYKRQSLWEDSIKPFLQNTPFLLKHLQNNHWLDVTEEHTKTTTISYKFPESIKVPFSYICIMDNGEWKPIYFGITNKTNTAIFRNMGCRMLYHIAIPKNNGYKLTGHIVTVNEKGEMLHTEPDILNRITMHLTKVNNGKDFWVRKGKVYGLYAYGSNNQWNLVDTKKCTTDSAIAFHNVPNKGLYKLINKNGPGKLERIFTYEKEAQIWW